jgi:hypothetical protein
MIESCESMIDEQHNSSVVNRDFKLKRKTLQDAPRDADNKLERLLRSKEREKDEAMHIKDIERLVTEIEMLRTRTTCSPFATANGSIHQLGGPVVIVLVSLPL